MLREEIAFVRDSVMQTEALKSKIACTEGSAKPRCNHSVQIVASYDVTSCPPSSGAELRTAYRPG